MIKRSPFISVFLLIILIFPACRQENYLSSGFDIIKIAIEDKGSPFFIDKPSYPKNLRPLPIGVFDSGTGGLSVLNSILILDEFNNETHKPGSDGIPDFKTESFVYLADEANMPYGNYAAEGKAEFLRELVLKDVIFLNQAPVKSIVIACNTATAFGLDTVRKAMEFWGLGTGDLGLGIDISGIVEAGSRQVLEIVEQKDKKQSVVGILATQGTVSSGAYPGTIEKLHKRLAPDKDISTIQQAGIGLAGAIDGDVNYVDPSAESVRDASDYFGPGLNNPDFPINPEIWELYNFTEGNELFVDKDADGKLQIVQLNSVQNYVRFMITELFVQLFELQSNASLEAIILGCTHYPYVEDEIRDHLEYLKNQDKKYKKLISPDLTIIDPAESLAIELYKSLNDKELFAEGSVGKNMFYISVPNTDLAENQIDELGEFPYSWKYGREINTMMQYVKRVPFSRVNIKPDVMDRIKKDLPEVFELMNNE